MNNNNNLIRRNLLHVYIYEKGFPCKNTPIIEWRQKEISSDITRNQYARGDKFWTWKLLEKACRKSLGRELNDLNPHRIETQRVVIDGYYVSMSNSKDFVMVAVSSKPVGVDIQVFRPSATAFRKDSGVWSENELDIVSEKDLEFNCQIWANKEALYKMLDPGFSYEENKNKVDTIPYQDYFVNGVEDEMYFWSISSELIKNGSKPKIFKWPLLSER